MKINKDAKLQDTTNKNSEPGGKRLDQEQLKNILNQVGMQNNQLRNQLKEVNDKLYAYQRTEFYTVLEWNWKALNSTSPLLTSQFKKECAGRFMAMMTPQKEEVNKPVVDKKK